MEQQDDGVCGWTIDFMHACSLTGVLLAFWISSRLRATRSSIASEGYASPKIIGIHRLPLSEFLRLLRGGAVTAVTYVADRPPAGALLVTALPGVLSSAQARVVPASTADAATVVAAARRQGDCTVAETLLLPGCHDRLFEELRISKGVLYECAEMQPEAGSADLSSRLSLLVDIGGLVASLAAIAYLMRSSDDKDTFSGKRLEDASADGAEQRRPKITFDDVAGMEQTKEELREVISFLRNPDGFYALGARSPKGLLLAGPSGTGKTLLARAVSGEAGVPFLYASAASFVEIYVGTGAKRIRELFEQARACAPCIVFLDELDAVGAAREGMSAGNNQEYVQTLNQLLLELDGVECHTGNSETPLVVTIAATNRYDSLDEALVRPGRLDRIVLVGMPNFAERVETLKIHARSLRCEDLDFEALARRTEGMSGADLAGLLNEAALLAARRRAEAVGMGHVAEILRTPRPKQRRHGGVAPGQDMYGDAGDAADGEAQGMAGAELWTRMLATMAAALVQQNGVSSPTAAAPTSQEEHRPSAVDLDEATLD